MKTWADINIWYFHCCYLSTPWKNNHTADYTSLLQLNTPQLYTTSLSHAERFLYLKTGLTSADTGVNPNILGIPNRKVTQISCFSLMGPTFCANAGVSVHNGNLFMESDKEICFFYFTKMKRGNILNSSWTSPNSVNKVSKIIGE